MHLCARRQTPAREDARAPRAGMLTQPGCSHPFRATRMLLLLLHPGESKGRVAAGPLAVWGSLRHSLPRGPTRGTRRELTKWGEVGAGGGTPGSRRRARSSHPNWKEPVPPGADAEPPQPRAARGFSRGVPLPACPQPVPRSSRRGWDWAVGAPRRCGKRSGPGAPRAPRQGCWRRGCRRPEHARAPRGWCSKAPGSGRAGAQGRARVGGAGRRARDPRGRGAGGPAGPCGWLQTATPLPSVTPSPGPGRARARRGPDPRGPARARQAGPLLGGARRSQHMVGGGAPPRPAETGCSRYRIRDRQRRGAGARAAARRARAQAAGVGGGGEGVAGVPKARPWVGGRGRGAAGRAPGAHPPEPICGRLGPTP